MSDSKLFTRDDIFAMRARYDAGESPREIWRSYPRASLLAVTRAARRETFREIGVGGTERAIVSGRLGGQGNTPRMETSMRERAEREVAALPEMRDDEPSPEMLARARESFQRATQPAVHPVDAFLAARKAPRNPLDDDTPEGPSDEDIAAAEALTRHTQVAGEGNALLDELRGDPSK
jgi:hypothetical protein